MKLSIVIICWNDLKVIGDCLKSIFDQDYRLDYEVIVSDNGSTDESVDYIRRHYPKVRIVENNANLGFARGNNAGIRVTVGQYVLILNPDTIVHKGALDNWIEYADRHPEAGAFGCRVLNPDGTFQQPAQVFPAIRRYWLEAVGLHKLARYSDWFACGEYDGWDGSTERAIDWQSGCCILVRNDLLHRLNGFDERFFYHFEEVDLCKRIWEAGYCILYYPDATITHLAGQSVKRFPIRFALEKLRNRYRYCYKHLGRESLSHCRRVTLAALRVRQLYFGVRRLFHSDANLDERLAMYRTAIAWNRRLDPYRFIQTGDEPDLGHAPLAPPPRFD